MYVGERLAPLTSALFKGQVQTVFLSSVSCFSQLIKSEEGDREPRSMAARRSGHWQVDRYLQGDSVRTELNCRVPSGYWRTAWQHGEDTHHGAFFLGGRQPPCIPTWQREREIKLSGAASRKSTNPTTEGPTLEASSEPNYLPKTSLRTPSPWGLGVHTLGAGGNA